MSNVITVHCPYCMEEKLISEKGADDKVHHCEACERAFKKKDAVTDFNKPESQIKIKHLRSYLWLYLIPLFLTVLVCNYIANHIADIDGPEFLVLYVVVLIVSYVVSRLNLPWMQGMSVICLLAIGAVRIFYGYKAGMQDFIILILLMLIGAFVIGSNQSFWSNDKSGSGGGCSGGCGSGCGGGGGCGGCG